MAPEPAVFEPAQENYEAAVRDSFGRQSIMDLIGASMTTVEPGRVEIVLPYRPDLCQQHGFFHAGVTATIADSAGGYAAMSLFPGDASVLTTEFKINLLAPAAGARLRALGQVVKAGRTLSICDVEVFAEEGDKSLLCAKMLQSLICLRDRPDR